MSINFDLKFMREAFELSKNCPISHGAYSVGSVIVDKNNQIISTGYSRETADNVHAEEVAIYKAIEKGINLKGATIYATMEPCGLRLSGKKCCADHIRDSKITRVVYGVNEPPHLVQNTTGIQKLKDYGILVEQLEHFNQEIYDINKHFR